MFIVRFFAVESEGLEGDIIGNGFGDEVCFVIGGIIFDDTVVRIAFHSDISFLGCPLEIEFFHNI